MPNLRILGQKKVGTVKKTVKSALGVELVIYDQTGEKASDDVTIGSIRTKKPEQVEVRVVGQTLVKNVIRFFESNYGIKVDILTGDGGMANLNSTLGAVKRTYIEKYIEINEEEVGTETSNLSKNENFEGQLTQKQIDDAGVKYHGSFCKLTVMRIEDVLAENGDYVSAVNGYLDGQTCRVGILRCDFNSDLNDSPLAFFCDGELAWFSIDHDDEFFQFVLNRVNKRLKLSTAESSVLQLLISEDDAAYDDCMPDSWSWTTGEGGEIFFSGKSDLRGKLAVNITHFHEHTVNFAGNEEYGEAYSETAEEEADDDSEFAAISLSNL